MTDTFRNNNNTFNSPNDSNAIPDLFPPLGEALQFDSMTISTHQDKHSDNTSDDVLWNEYHNNNNTAAASSSTTPPIQSSIASSSSNSNNESSSGGVFNISWGGGNDRPPAELHLDQETELVSRKPLPKPRGVRRLPEPEPAEDGTLDEDTLRRRRNTYAARRSRMKKFLKIEYLENRVNQLQTENAKLVLNNALLESEKRGWAAKELNTFDA